MAVTTPTQYARVCAGTHNGRAYAHAYIPPYPMPVHAGRGAATRSPELHARIGAYECLVSVVAERIRRDYITGPESWASARDRARKSLKRSGVTEHVHAGRYIILESR